MSVNSDVPAHPSMLTGVFLRDLGNGRLGRGGFALAGLFLLFVMGASVIAGSVLAGPEGLTHLNHLFDGQIAQWFVSLRIDQALSSPEWVGAKLTWLVVAAVMLVFIAGLVVVASKRYRDMGMPGWFMALVTLVMIGVAPSAVTLWDTTLLFWVVTAVLCAVPRDAFNLAGN
ncbi:MAG: DUF805 domain-containing protein [Pseudomonadota bacterium]